MKIFHYPKIRQYKWTKSVLPLHQEPGFVSAGQEGAKECAARRSVAMAEEERMRKEGEAFYAAHIKVRARWRGS